METTPITLDNVQQHMRDAIQAEQYEAAAKCADIILEHTAAAEAIYVGGLALVGCKKYQSGFEWLRAAISLTGHPEWALTAVARLLIADYGIGQREDYDRAEELLATILRTNLCWQDRLHLEFLLAICMSLQQRHDEAIALIDKLFPGKVPPEAVLLKVRALDMKGDVAAGLALIDTLDPTLDHHSSLPGEPGRPITAEEVANYRSWMLWSLGRPREAREALDPYRGSTQRATNYHLALMDLGFADFPDAWHLYRAREVYPGRAVTLDEIRDKRLYFFAEQGYGDTFQFIRYAMLLRPLVKQLIIGVPRGMVKLAQTLPIDALVVDYAELPIPEHDVEFPMLDAAALFETTIETIPRQIPYLHVEPPPIKQQQRKRIGLIWAGGFRPLSPDAHSIDRRRSIPFADLDPILNLHDRFEFISLQLHSQDDPRLAEQPMAIGTERVPTEGPEPSADWYDTAKQLHGLDLLISVDTAAVHLAGAMNLPVWMLSRFDGCWRWFFVEKGHPFYAATPWYPSVRIFRQTAPGNYSELLQHVAEELLQWDEDNDT